MDEEEYQQLRAKMLKLLDSIEEHLATLQAAAFTKVCEEEAE